MMSVNFIFKLYFFFFNLCPGLIIEVLLARGVGDDDLHDSFTSRDANDERKEKVPCFFFFSICL